MYVPACHLKIVLELKLQISYSNLQLEIYDDEKITTLVSGEAVSNGGQLPNNLEAAVKANATVASLADELDNLMDISIEIASNKRMKKDYIKPFKLTFKDKDLERKVCKESHYQILYIPEALDKFYVQFILDT